MTAYESLSAHWKEVSLIGSINAVLGWDQEVLMPERGVELRGRQLALLSSLRHQREVDVRVGEWLDECEADSASGDDEWVRANLRLIRKAHRRAVRTPATWVEANSKATSRAMHVWARARKENDFAAFAPCLAEIIELRREQAQFLGVPEGGEAWDVLADQYDEGLTERGARKVLEPLATTLRDLLERVRENQQVDTKMLQHKIPVEQQKVLMRQLLKQIGFELNAGRLDESAHPFCSGTGPVDVRLTARYKEDDLPEAILATLHEGGHGLYEQGLLLERLGMPAGRSCGMTVHESQSRLFENHVGRSLPFWQWLMPVLSQQGIKVFEGVSADALWRAGNRVTPGLIRVGADEVSYHLHIVIRFEIECALMRNEIEAVDVPEMWNELYRKWLGIEVPNDAQGCLQDIQWAMGAIGYFPTYTLGTMLASQLFETYVTTHGDPSESFRQGDFSGLLQWLRAQVHSRGSVMTSAELCQAVSGQPLSAEPMLKHLTQKLERVYG